MKAEDLRRIISECCNEVLFICAGTKAGITSEVHDYVPKFRAWYGTEVKVYSDVDDMMSDNFFGGKSLVDLVEKVEFMIV